jgi:hypothetical protein
MRLIQRPRIPCMLVLAFVALSHPLAASAA